MKTITRFNSPTHLKSSNRITKPVTKFLFSLGLGFITSTVLLSPQAANAAHAPLETLFPAGHPWTQDISTAALDPQSAALISTLNSRGGWGTGSMRITFSFNILTATSTTPTYKVVDLPAEPHYSPDCDINFAFPLPAGGAIEEENGYTCTSGGDCHILVHDPIRKVLFESYRSNVSGTTLQSTCAIRWDLTRAYTPTLRGDQCTSTDAAGLPVTPLVFSADEVAAGSINHAIRFVLPNNRISAAYVRPATHGTKAATGGATGIPYGARLRLKASYDISKYSPRVQVIMKAMKKYGIILADGGNIALTATTDKFTTNKWSSLGITSYSLSALKVTDFEVVNGGTRIPVTYNCKRNY